MVAAAALGVPGAQSAVGQCDVAEIGKLWASDGADGDRFGRSIAVDGSVLLVGTGAESAYVFRYDGSAWTVEQKLLADNPPSDFGFSVALSADVALVGAPSDDDGANLAGAAHVFRFDGTSWVHEQKLVASDAAISSAFGAHVATNGVVALIGAPNDHDLSQAAGAAYVFGYDGSTWVEEQKLMASDGLTWDRFGVSGAINGDVAMIGTRQSNLMFGGPGSAYVFRDNGSIWVEEQKLLAADGAIFDYFGHYLAMDGNLALIGAWGDDDAGEYSGSVYAFRYDGTAWIQEQKLLASDAVPHGTFGRAAVMRGDTAVIGAWGSGATGESPGSAYLLHHDGSAWVEEETLTASDGAAADVFGFGVALRGDSIVISAPYHDENGEDTGSIYFFGRPFDLDWDGTVGVVDLIVLLTAWGTDPGGPPDFDGDGSVGGTDLLALLAAWGSCGPWALRSTP